MVLFEKPEYTSDELKLHIKRLEREIKELQNQYNTALLRSKEMFSKPHSIRESMECFSKYGSPREIKYVIESCKDSILIYKNMLKNKKEIWY